MVVATRGRTPAGVAPAATPAFSGRAAGGAGPGATAPAPERRRGRGGRRRGRPAGAWAENSAQVDVPVPLAACFELWQDRERIPDWMPWIQSVTVQADDPKRSLWLLRTDAFGQTFEFSWMARNKAPLPNQKIHWQSVPGSVGGSLGAAIEVANKGEIRFYPRTKDSCAVKLTISYEVPQALLPMANALGPLVTGVLEADMERFVQVAVAEQGATAKP